MIEVFKTNVRRKRHAKYLIQQIGQRYPSAFSSFDLEDCDRVLRVKADIFSPLYIIQMLADNGFECQVLK
jgi:hypothetical protein